MLHRQNQNVSICPKCFNWVVGTKCNCAKKKTIKKLSPKRQAIEKEYRKVQAEIAEERFVVCEGCGNVQGFGCTLSFSHSIPRSRRPDLIADKENISLHCQERCHKLCESGDYDMLLNGEQIKEYIKKVDQKYFLIKILK